jgi:acetoin utilization protein AcuB
MLVRDYMTTNVTTLTDDLRLLDAALMIRRTGKRHVPILSATTGKVIGIISDRDISRLAPSVLSTPNQDDYNRVFEETPITAAMTKAPITISPDANIIEAVQILYSKKVGGLLAVENGELKGILTVSDMLGLLNELLTGGDKSSSMGNAG